MTNDISHQPNTIPWPPLIYLPGVALGFILNWLFPLPWITRPLSEILFAFGWLIAAGGIAMIAMAIRAMRRADTTLRPHRGADHLVTTGPFALTRNPLYVGNTMIMIALGLISGIAWFRRWRSSRRSSRKNSRSSGRKSTSRRSSASAGATMRRKSGGGCEE